MSDTQATGAVAIAIESFDKLRKLRAALENEERNFPQRLLTAAIMDEMSPTDSTHAKLMNILVLTLADSESGLIQFLKKENAGQEAYQTKMRQIITSILVFYGEMKQGERAEEHYRFWLPVSPREIFDVHVDWSNARIKAEQLQRG